MRTTPCDALQADTEDRGEEGGAVTAPPRRRVEGEDNSDAALQRGSDQGRRDQRRAEARHQDFVPDDSSSSSESTSSEGSSDASASEGSERTNLKASQSPAAPSGGSRGGGTEYFPSLCHPKETVTGSVYYLGV